MTLQKVGRRKADPQENQPEPKERIFSSALQLFQEKGYSGVSIRDIMAAADVTQATIYHHFGDKKGLYKAIVAQTLEDILRELRRAALSSYFENQLSEMLIIFYRYRKVGVGTLLYEMTTHEDFTVKDLQLVGSIMNNGWRSTVERVVRDAMRRGEIRRGNVAFYTQVIIEMGFSFARSPIGNWTGWDEERQINEVVSLLLNGLGSDRKPGFI